MKKFNFDFYKTELIDGERDIYIYREPVDDLMRKQLVSYSACVRLRFIIYVYDTIIYDSNFEKLPESVKKFFIQHEVGHIKNKDLDIDIKTRGKLAIKRLFFITPEMEYKADAYAVSVVGKEEAIKALKYMSKLDISLAARVDIYKRIRKIRRD